MQITAELDSQHLEKLRELEQLLSANTSELIALAIDHIYQINNKNKAIIPKEKNQKLIEMLAGIGEGSEDGSVKYKEYVREYLNEKFKHHC